MINRICCRNSEETVSTHDCPFYSFITAVALLAMACFVVGGIFAQTSYLVAGGIAVLINIIAIAIKIVKSRTREMSDPGNITTRSPHTEFLFRVHRSERSLVGCCGTINAERAEAVKEALRRRAPRGISYNLPIGRAIQGSCTAMSLEFATTYFRLRAQSEEQGLSEEDFLQTIYGERGRFEESSEEIRSRQMGFSVISVDRSQQDVDFSKAKIDSWVGFHHFQVDHFSRMIDVNEEGQNLQGEVEALPHGVYLVRMLKPSNNHKLEDYGHSLIYVNEANLRLFYDCNWGVEKIAHPMRGDYRGAQLSEQLLSAHREWDVPKLRFYRLIPENVDII